TGGQIMETNGSSQAESCRVVGVRKNGERVIIAEMMAGPIADTLLRLIKLDSDFIEVVVEPVPAAKAENGETPQKRGSRQTKH
ncbi:MAG TPA: hypothetical protein VGH74_13275, partial [Planctomycetaceae bacterium]